MTATHDVSKFALQLDEMLDALRIAGTPDPIRIADTRAMIDALVEEQKISMKEWRRLVEKCAQIRRTPRT